MRVPRILQLVSIAIAVLLAPSAHALFRAYLDTTGSDSAPCTLVAPCRLLPAALAAVDFGGEIWMLESANYNTATVVISKSVSILAVPGTVGSVLAIGGPAIVIAPGVKVALRNLAVGPLAGTGGTDGVQLGTGSTLQVENTVFMNLSGYAVRVPGAGTLRVAHSTVRNCGAGVLLENGADGVVAHSVFASNFGTALGARSDAASAFTRGVLSDATVADGSGVLAQASASGASAQVIVTRSTIHRGHTALGVSANNAGTAEVYVSGTTVTGALFGWNISGTGAAIHSYGNNQFALNPSTIGALSYIGQQ